MSWSNVFPILTDELVDEYASSPKTRFRKDVIGWFTEKQTINERKVSHIISISLFWKNIRCHQPDIVITGRAFFMSASKRKLLRFEPWNHYVKPVLEGAYALQVSGREDVAFRVYLAADMEFLIPDLVEAGCEVRLMKSTSIRHNPGAMWRFLALAETDILVTVIDADRANNPFPDILRTESMASAGLCWWRVPVWGELNEVGHVSYRPFVALQFGMAGGLPGVKIMMEALVWACKTGKIEVLARLPTCSPKQIHGTVWPDYGFDEWFLLAAVYPRAAYDGLLSFIPSDTKSRLLPLDIQYASKANERSELQYFGSPGGSCCAGLPEPLSKQYQNHLDPSLGSYWSSLSHFPLVLNHLALTGTLVTVGSLDLKWALNFLSGWHGAEWHAIITARQGPTFPLGTPQETQETFDKSLTRKAMTEAGSGRTRILIHVGGEAKRAQATPNDSLDAAWLELDGDYSTITDGLNRWWPKIRLGGLIAGPRGIDDFQGSPLGVHEWLATRQALKQFCLKQGCRAFYTRELSPAWIIPKFTPPKPHEIMVFTGFTKGVVYAKDTIANHKAYCERRGYQYRAFKDVDFDKTRAPTWSKIPFARMALRQAKWVFWIDVDAVFNDWNAKLEDFCLPEFSMICGIWNDTPGPRPSMGTFMLQRGAEVDELLSDMWAYPHSHRGGSHEEDAIKSVISTKPSLARRVFAVDTRELNSLPPTQDWGMDDSILHFLQVKAGREAIIRDACRMIWDRNNSA